MHRLHASMGANRLECTRRINGSVSISSDPFSSPERGVMGFLSHEYADMWYNTRR